MPQWELATDTNNHSGSGVVRACAFCTNPDPTGRRSGIIRIERLSSLGRSANDYASGRVAAGEGE
jgi:hypothetical protein